MTKNSRGLPLISQSDLNDKLNLKYTIPNEVQNTLSSKEELSNESCPRKHLTSRKISQNRDHTPRKGLSLISYKGISLFSSSAPTITLKEKESKTEKNHALI